MTHISRRRWIAVLVAAHLMVMAALAAPAAAMQILEAADHAELAAEISATNVNRIALHGDRIARLVRAPDGFAVEHDAASGDLYLRPAGEGSVGGGPVTLFIGTEKGFTYRLTLTPVASAASGPASTTARETANTAAVRRASPQPTAPMARAVPARAFMGWLPRARCRRPRSRPAGASPPSRPGLRADTGSGC